MPLKCSVFIAMSLDGFIAGVGGDLTWLNELSARYPGEDYGFDEFYRSVDILVMGRKTFETALTFPQWPYAGKRVVVLSHDPRDSAGKMPQPIEWMSGSIRQIISNLEQSGARHAYVDGGSTIQGFLQAGAIDEMTVTLLPILLGGGIPLFGNLERRIDLHLLSSKEYSSGFVQNRYSVVR